MFLGFDVGTQSLKIALFSKDKYEIVYECTVTYDKELPHYKTQNGVNIKGNQVTVPTLLWVEALELAFEKMKKDKINFEEIKCVSGSGQQHGSVYWKNGSLKTLQKLDTNKSLVEQLEDCFLCESPIWMDASTQQECDDFEKKVKDGPEGIAKISGSRAYCRFTGVQIAKLYKKGVLKECERISLVSSFFCSLFLEDYAPIDFSDGSGMNLLDLINENWSQELLQGLDLPLEIQNLLGKPVHSIKTQKISFFMCKKYNFDSNCLINVFSGDNLNSACFVLRNKGDIAISLGTSHTAFGFVKNFIPNPKEGHVFLSPMTDLSQNFFNMTVISNGGLIRNEFCKKYCNDDWKIFEEYLKNTPSGNNGKLGFYFLYPEITPTTTKVGTFRFDENKEVDSFEPKEEVRALVESQIRSLKVHSSRLGLGKPSRIIATGGSSQSKEVLQIISDIFNCEVFISDHQNSASYGACLRAVLSFNIFVNENLLPIGDVDMGKIISNLEDFILVAKPNQESVKVYAEMEPKFLKKEEFVINKLN